MIETYWWVPWAMLATGVPLGMLWAAKLTADELNERHGRERDRLLEAIRLTQEYAQLPALDGWSWWDAYRRHRPDDAARLRSEWLARQRAMFPDHADEYRDDGHLLVSGPVEIAWPHLGERRRP